MERKSDDYDISYGEINKLPVTEITEGKPGASMRIYTKKPFRCGDIVLSDTFDDPAGMAMVTCVSVPQGFIEVRPMAIKI